MALWNEKLLSVEKGMIELRECLTRQSGEKQNSGRNTEEGAEIQMMYKDKYLEYKLKVEEQEDIIILKDKQIRELKQQQTGSLPFREAPIGDNGTAVMQVDSVAELIKIKEKCAQLTATLSDYELMAVELKKQKDNLEEDMQRMRSLNQKKQHENSPTLNATPNEDLQKYKEKAETLSKTLAECELQAVELQEKKDSHELEVRKLTREIKRHQQQNTLGNDIVQGGIDSSRCVESNNTDTAIQTNIQIDGNKSAQEHEAMEVTLENIEGDDKMLDLLCQNDLLQFELYVKDEEIKSLKKQIDEFIAATAQSEDDKEFSGRAKEEIERLREKCEKLTTYLEETEGQAIDIQNEKSKVELQLKRMTRTKEQKEKEISDIKKENKEPKHKYDKMEHELLQIKVDLIREQNKCRDLQTEIEKRSPLNTATSETQTDDVTDVPIVTKSVAKIELKCQQLTENLVDCELLAVKLRDENSKLEDDLRKEKRQNKRLEKEKHKYDKMEHELLQIKVDLIKEQNKCRDLQMEIEKRSPLKTATSETQTDDVTDVPIVTKNVAKIELKCQQLTENLEDCELLAIKLRDENSKLENDLRKEKRQNKRLEKEIENYKTVEREEPTIAIDLREQNSKHEEDLRKERRKNQFLEKEIEKIKAEDMKQTIPDDTELIIVKQQLTELTDEMKSLKQKIELKDQELQEKAEKEKLLKHFQENALPKMSKKIQELRDEIAEKDKLLNNYQQDN